MLFGMAGRLDPGMRQVVGTDDCPTGRGNFGGKCGVPLPHCNQRGHCGIVVKKERPSSLL